MTKTHEEIDALKEQLITVVLSVREEINNEYNLNENFVDYCDLCSDMVFDKLSLLGLDSEVVFGHYHHKYPNSKIDYYGHYWVECDGFIIDASSDQFDNMNFVINKETHDCSKYIYGDPEIHKLFNRKNKLKL